MSDVELTNPGKSVKPRALDLYCGSGGATRGLQFAGFHVTGVDIKPQPRYCGDVFIQADALTVPLDYECLDCHGTGNFYRHDEDGDFLECDCYVDWENYGRKKYSFIWASPPCQRFANISKVSGRQLLHPDLIDPTRKRLAESCTQWCIENVWGAPLRHDLVLDGGMFGANTWRRRIFELSFFCLQPDNGVRFGPVTRPGSVSVVGHTGGAYKARHGSWVKNGSHAAWSRAMGIDWMTAKEMAQAIPPAYAEFIGRQALQVIRFPKEADITQRGANVRR